MNALISITPQQESVNLRAERYHLCAKYAPPNACPQLMTEPVTLQLKGARGSSHTLLFVIRHPDGSEEKMITNAVAALVGITPHNFRQRLKRLGWEHPDLFAPPVRRGKGLPILTLAGDRAGSAGANQYTVEPMNEGNAAWRALGKRPRHQNLQKIVFGELELKYLQGEGR